MEMTLKEKILTTALGEWYKIHALGKFRRKWRKINSHNGTTVNSYFDIENVKVGKESYGEINVVTFGNECNITIGHYVSIAQEVVFIANAEHYTDHITTFPMKVKILQNIDHEAFSKGDIIVDDDVWIGYGVKILSGVHIGQGAVIAAGAVVKDDAPPYSIVGGIPAKVLKYRFSQEVRDRLINLDYASLTKEDIEAHIDELYLPISDKDPDEVEKMYSWFPRKRQ